MASLLHPTVRLDLRRRFDCASLRVHAERRAIPFFSFLFQGGVYQSPETNLPPQHVSIIIILPIYTTALVHNKHICLSVRPVCLSGERENFIRIPQPKPVSANFNALQIIKSSTPVEGLMGFRQGVLLATTCFLFGKRCSTS